MLCGCPDLLKFPEISFNVLNPVAELIGDLKCHWMLGWNHSCQSASKKLSTIVLMRNALFRRQSSSPKAVVKESEMQKFAYLNLF